MKYLALAALILAACTDDTDPPWQLDHDRIIAVRATPPHLAAGEHAVIDGLVGAKGAAVREGAPDEVTLLSAYGTVARDGTQWRVTAPDDATLARARADQALPAGAPVPLVLDARYGGFHATKTVWLGSAAANPAMTDIDVNQQGEPTAPITITPDTKVPMSIALDDEHYDVTWLSSCGTMHDFDLPTAYLRIEKDDPTAGQLVLVVRDASGGVNWKIWSIGAN